MWNSIVQFKQFFFFGTTSVFHAYSAASFSYKGKLEGRSSTERRYKKKSFFRWCVVKLELLASVIMDAAAQGGAGWVGDK